MIARMPQGDGPEETRAGEPDGTTAAGRSTLRLLAQARLGDDGALGDLYARYLPRLQRWARGRLPRWARSAADTDDLVQDALLRSLHAIQAFDPRHSGAFQAYLRKGVLNRLRDEIRRAGRRPQPGELGEPVAPGPTPIEEAIGREALERYESALERIHPDDREAILGRI